MNNVIYKYVVKDVLLMPRNAQIIHAAIQNENMTIWALVDITAPLEERRFVTYGTGQTINDLDEHIITWFEGPSVWHLFERKYPRIA